MWNVHTVEIKKFLFSNAVLLCMVMYCSVLFCFVMLGIAGPPAVFKFLS